MLGSKGANNSPCLCLQSVSIPLLVQGGPGLKAYLTEPGGYVHNAVVDSILDVLLTVGVWVAADGLPAGLWPWKCCSLGADGGGGGGSVVGACGQPPFSCLRSEVCR